MTKHGTPRAELKLGDHVRIPGDDLEGRVVGVHPHKIEVEVLVDGHNERRHYPHESLERIATLDEASNYVDH